jgi:aminobenzoyl-glutamate transport protein
MTKAPATPNKSVLQRLLDGIEKVGNRLPDPAVLFAIGLALTWILSWLLSGASFQETDPRTDKPIQINNMLSLQALAAFLAGMVKTFTDFHPLGVVLVALLGVGVAEHAGFINAGLKGLLSITPRRLLTPMLILVGLLSHTAADAGYVLVIPMGGVLFYAAGRHPLAGVVAAFAGVSGGFSANPVVCGLDPLLSGLTTTGAHIRDAMRDVNPLCNYYFTASSSILIMLAGWYLTDRVIEPRLRNTRVDGDPADMPKLEPLSAPERRGLYSGLLSMALLGLVILLWALPGDSSLRAADGSLTRMGPGAAPLMGAIVPLIFLLFLVPGIVHGYVSGTFKSHRDIIKGMSRSMGTMAYYLVLVFFAAIFIDAFNKSNLGALLAIKGAAWLKEMGASAQVSVAGLILVAAAVNLLIGSASAKWALLAPIFVPMFMTLGISPELTQAAYRVGDSCTNIITPMMPYFPLVVVFCQRYVKSTGIGTLTALMLPYSLVFLVLWTIYLLVYWQLGIPLGVQGGYTYP